MNYFAIVITLVGLIIFVLVVTNAWRFQRIPPPQVGQVWRSEHSGRQIRISEARIGDSGQLLWAYQLQRGDGWNPVNMSGEGGLYGWRQMVRDERRVLVGPPHPIPPPAPPSY